MPTSASQARRAGATPLMERGASMPACVTPYGSLRKSWAPCYW